MLPDKYKIENNESSQKKIEDAKKVAAAGLEGKSKGIFTRERIQMQQCEISFNPFDVSVSKTRSFCNSKLFKVFFVTWKMRVNPNLCVLFRFSFCGRGE